MVGLRNVLTHAYWIVDSDKAYDSLQEDLQDLDRFREHIPAFLDKHGEAEK
jgi:uncharacterized protein YutE (UPF0331/DUF86 family)